MLLIAAFLFTACGQDNHSPSTEFAALPVYELSHPQPAKVVHKNGGRSLTGFLSDCESQLDRIKDGFSAAIGQPHK